MREKNSGYIRNVMHGLHLFTDFHSSGDGLIKFDPASEMLDLEDKALLHKLIQEWCYTVDPEELAGLVSALRDCKEDWRRESIMDDIISFAYQQTPTHLESESAWRRKVERRLPDK